MSKLPLTEPEISKFAEELGRMLLRVPLVSGIAGHERIEYTARDYVRAEKGTALEFFRDVLTRAVPEVLLKWYPSIETKDDGPIFSFPDCLSSGGPGASEMRVADKKLSARGETPADYNTPITATPRR